LAGLLITLILKLIKTPGGLILSGLFLGGLVIGIILLGCLALSSLVRLFYRKISFAAIFFTITAISLAFFHYRLYSPTLKIIVPENYSGEVILVISNVAENVLTVDNNGIGYIDQQTFGRTYTRPVVVDRLGKQMDDLCIGFNASSFWVKGTACCLGGKQIHYLSFKIATQDATVQDQDDLKQLTELVDTSLVKRYSR